MAVWRTPVHVLAGLVVLLIPLMVAMGVLTVLLRTSIFDLF